MVSLLAVKTFKHLGAALFFYSHQSGLLVYKSFTCRPTANQSFTCYAPVCASFANVPVCFVF